jgi:hypothetical protein
MPGVFGKKSRLPAFCLSGHALAVFRFIEGALDPGTHTVSPKASNPFTISPISQRREERAAVIYCLLDGVRFEQVGVASDGLAGDFIRPQRSQGRLPTSIDHAMIASWDATQMSQQYPASSQPMG